MKQCPYCGAKYPGDLVNCPIDNESLVEEPVPQPPPTNKYEIPPASAVKRNGDWATILIPRDSFEANLVFNRLQVSGIRVRMNSSVIGGGISTDTMTFIQVHIADYDAARDLLNAE